MGTTHAVGSKSHRFDQIVYTYKKLTIYKQKNRRFPQTQVPSRVQSNKVVSNNQGSFKKHEDERA